MIAWLRFIECSWLRSFQHTWQLCQLTRFSGWIVRIMCWPVILAQTFGQRVFRISLLLWMLMHRHFASSAFSLVSPSRNVGGDDVDFLDRSASDAVLLDGDLLCLVFQHIFVATGPICSRVDCPCTSTYNGGELGHCCRTCFRGRACTHNIHRTPFYPFPPLRPARVALVCSAWREAWDEAQTEWVKRPYPAALHWLQGIVYDVSVQARRDADRLSREAASRREMGVGEPALST